MCLSFLFVCLQYIYMHLFLYVCVYFFVSFPCIIIYVVLFVLVVYHDFYKCLCVCPFSFVCCVICFVSGVLNKLPRRSSTNQLSEIQVEKPGL